MMKRKRRRTRRMRRRRRRQNNHNGSIKHKIMLQMFNIRVTFSRLELGENIVYIL